MPKPGGRFAVANIVTRGAVPEQLPRDMLLWVECVAGALDEDEYRAKLATAGFEAIDGKIMSAFGRARKSQP